MTGNDTNAKGTTMTTINGQRVCRYNGEWVCQEDAVLKTCERILGLLSDGPKTRRYFGKVMGITAWAVDDAPIIDCALRRLVRAGRVTASVGPVLNKRRGRTYAIVSG